MNLNYNKLQRLIAKSIKKAINEAIEGQSPDYVEFDGDNYEALIDEASVCLLYHNGKWLSTADTHRDIICLCEYGCEEWELEDYYGHAESQQIHRDLDRLWSENISYKWPVRLFKAKTNAASKGLKYLLVSWDDLNENIISDICNFLNIDRQEVKYIGSF